MKQTYDKNEFYRAHLARDPRFDGQFFVAVKTTGIYCRPICPARKAKLENVEFFIHAAQAEAAGYRPCLRCRPETAPGSAAWLGTSDTVQRALRIMNHFVGDELSINALAQQLGIGERWLRELFQQQVGVSPQAILMTKKLDMAINLLDSSSLSITDIAFSAGFQSLRRFNDAFKARFHKTPREFRKTPSNEGQIKLQLSYRPPFDWNHLLHYFKQRTIDGIERVEGNSYQRLFTAGIVRGWFQIKPCANSYKLEVEFKLNQSANLLEYVARLKNMLDLDSDPLAIERALAEDPQLVPYLKQYPGLRVPGCWDGFEVAIRAIVGQRISVKAAHCILTRIVEVCGEEQHLDASLPLQRYFPTPDAILAADLSQSGLSAARVETVKVLAQAYASQRVVLDGTADYETTCKNLLAIKGIGPWTVEYIAMRALKHPNGFPETDLELQKRIKRFGFNPKNWTPWKAYAAMLLLSIKEEIKS